MDITSLSTNSPPGVYSLATKSGSSYTIEITPDSKTLYRVPSSNASNLRRDSEVLNIIGRIDASVNSPGYFELEGLGVTQLTIRQTTPIVSISKVS